MTSSPPPLQHPQIKNTAVADGSSTTTSTSTATPWNCETNWTVTRGSLDSAVTFESFDFPIDSESTGPKPPLLLVPPSTSDFEPCEIKLNFTQKHEIRQIYVRSTARVYEIYYAPDLHSEKEYLCTVRCSAASVTDVKNAISANLEGLNEMLPKGRVSGENNIGTNEDDWVEIKLPVGRVDEGNTYLPNQTSNAIRNYQNYYEATAEINNSEPCASLTLRLLSLQSKAFVHVDEVYVFADCIHTDDSHKQTVNPEPSSGTSLMTMLVPTLLGLSKSRSIQSPGQHSSKSVEKPIDTESRPTSELTQCQLPPLTLYKDKVCDSTSGSDRIGIRDSKLGQTDELTRCQVADLNSDKDKTPLLPKTFNEPNTALMEELVSRVSRIEDILLRFEENMLKPINHIEARLHHVEQQLESLTKNSQIPVLPSSPTSQPKPENSNQNLIVESQHSEEKQEVNNDFEKPKKSVSIDDALAAALAGFSSFTKPNDEFPVLPLESPEEQCSTSVPSESLKPNVSVDVLNNSEDLTQTYSDPSTEIPSNKSDVDQDSIEAVNILTFDKKDDQCSDVKDGSESVNILTFDKKQDSIEAVNILTFDKKQDSIEAVNMLTSDKKDDQCSDVKDGSESVNILTFDKKQDSIEAVNKILTFDKNDILKYFPDGSSDGEDGFESGVDVDFETCVLEVKFASMENGNLKSNLEDFLSYTDENPTTIDEGVLLEERTGNGNGNGLLVDLDGDDMAEGVLQDLPNDHVEESFDSLI